MKKYLFAAMLLIFTGCKDYDRWVPVSKDDTAPPPVSNIKVKNIAGGATITYALPKSKSLLYVKAVYSKKDSANLEKKSSYYNNNITLKGFPDTNAYKINLYAVSRGGKESDPVAVTIHPLTPPVNSVFKSLVVKPTFGGINVQFQNESEADVKITVLTTDSLGDLYTARINYTEVREGNFSARGFDSVSRKFGIFVRDRWNNYSDTLFTEQKPWYEEEMDKSKFKEIHLQSDTYEEHCCGTGMINLWDDVWDVNNPVFHTKPNTGMPQWFTFDLGVTARLSRFKFYHRLASGGGTGTDGAYYAGDPKEIEVWGSNDPNTDGSWDSSWILLGHFKSIKPSGNGTPTTEDIQYACVQGEDFVFPLNNPPVRYLRIKVLDTWGGVTYMYMAELTFFGSVQ